MADKDLAVSSETEIEEIADYWKVRSETYSELNIEEMHSWKKDAWRRPLWDRKQLKELGMQRIVIAPDINRLIYDEMEQVRYRSVPMFAVSAEKPLKEL